MTHSNPVQDAPETEVPTRREARLLQTVLAHKVRRILRVKKALQSKPIVPKTGIETHPAADKAEPINPLVAMLEGFQDELRQDGRRASKRERKGIEQALGRFNGINRKQRRAAARDRNFMDKLTFTPHQPATEKPTTED